MNMDPCQRSERQCKVVSGENLFWIGAFKHSDGANMDCNFGLCQAILIQLESHIRPAWDNEMVKRKQNVPITNNFFPIGSF